jgi:hypothetical protein
MRSTWILLLLALFALAGCGGDNNPVNEGRDRPKDPKEKKTLPEK